MSFTVATFSSSLLNFAFIHTQHTHTHTFLHVHKTTTYVRIIDTREEEAKLSRKMMNKMKQLNMKMSHKPTIFTLSWSMGPYSLPYFSNLLLSSSSSSSLTYWWIIILSLLQKKSNLFYVAMKLCFLFRLVLFFFIFYWFYREVTGIFLSFSLFLLFLTCTYVQ